MNIYPKVSILLAAYNSGATIRESVQSVLNQNYLNLQMIICDDGTKEFDQGELEQFIQRQDLSVEVKIIHQSKNMGTVRNLNAGLDQADGEWLMLMAADDCFASDHAVESLMEQVLESGGKWAVARTRLCDEQLTPKEWSLPLPEVDAKIIARDIKAVYLQLCQGCCLPAGGSVYQMELLRQMGGFDETYRLTEDWPIFLKLVRQGSMPVVSDDELVLHRFGGVSRKNAGRNYDYQHDLITVLRQEVAPHLDLLDECGRETVCKLLREKELGFAFRFSCETRAEKLVWMMKHPLFMLKKFLRKREKIC